MFSLRNFYENSLNSFVFWTVWSNVKIQNEPESISSYIKQIDDLIFEKNEVEETPEELYDKASNSISNFILNSLNPIYLSKLDFFFY